MREPGTETGTIETQGASLFYRQAGAGTPVLLLHAGVADSRMWQALLAQPPDGMHLVAPDLKGYGRSPLPPNAFAYEDDAAALLDALGIETVWVVGVSFGGRVALDFALAHPERVRGLIIVSPLVPGLETGESLAAFGEEEERLLAADDLDAATELNLRWWVDGPYRAPEQVDRTVREHVGMMQTEAFRVPEPDGVGVRRREQPAGAQLQEIRLPVLVVAGDRDLPDVLRHAATLQEKIAGARLVTVPDAAHMLTMEVPALFSELVEGFTGEHTPGAAA